jgi:hypothetical protein
MLITFSVELCAPHPIKAKMKSNLTSSRIDAQADH